MNGTVDVASLAEECVDRICAEYPGVDTGEGVIVAAVGRRELLSRVLDRSATITPQIEAVAVEFLRLYGERNTDQKPQEYAAQYDLGVVGRAALVGLAAASIGASAGLASEHLNAILAGIVGANAAIMLNVLASLLKRPTNQEDEIDGLDLAVISILKQGNYTPEEVTKRISRSLDVAAVRASIKKLKKRNIIQPGRWRGTFTVS